MKALYLVRHCRSTGATPDAPLTDEGRLAAERLADTLADANIRRIVSSPYARARESIAPLAARLALEVELDDRLREWYLGAKSVPWEIDVRRSFNEPDLVFEGGESNRAASERAAATIGEALASDSGPSVLVTHGGTLVLMLRHFDRAIGWDTWHEITAPDVYRVTLDTRSVGLERIWREPT